MAEAPRKHVCPKYPKSVRGFLLIGMSLFLLFVGFVALKDHHHFDYKVLRGGYSYEELEESSLLPSGLDESSCLSRYAYDALLSQKPNFRKPSPHLVSMLRSYESRHEMCAPHTYWYNMTVAGIKSGTSSMPSKCKYAIWYSNGGLGNRMTSVASAFLYALLTNRVLLIHFDDPISNLFCEPFPKGSWLLPTDSPLVDKFSSFSKNSKDSFGTLLRNNMLGNSRPSSPSYVYVHLYREYDDLDKSFYCDEEQFYIQDVPWVIMRSDLYFAPSFFLMSCFERKLLNLFPDKGTVFHFLARYLFHPTNEVWGLVSRFYEGYLSYADTKVGLQVRVFHYDDISNEDTVAQLLSCTLREGILPGVDKHAEHARNPMLKNKNKVVLITSLNQYYYQQMRKLYWESATTTGEIIAIQQPSFELKQMTKNQRHNIKALADIYLLSLTDHLVTSAKSTFGYVAQGLGGLMPLIIHKSRNQTGQYPPCSRTISTEPCFHKPPNYDCKMRGGAPTGAARPYFQVCEDVPWGIKLIGP